MSYVERSLVPGETLLYETRHHWMVLIGPLLIALLFVALAAGLFVEAIDAKNGKGMMAGASSEAVHGMDFVAIALMAAASGSPSCSQPGRLPDLDPWFCDEVHPRRPARRRGSLSTGSAF